MSDKPTFDGSTKMRTPRTIWTPGDRTPVKDRLLRNWPLDDIDLDVPIVEADLDDGAQWPPQHAHARTERLNVYADLYRGDASHFHADPDASRVFVNWFRRLITITTTQVVRQVTEPADVDPIMVMGTDAMRYGRSYPLNVNGNLLIGDSRQCWADGDDDDVLWVVIPRVTRRSTDGKPDEADVYWVTPEGGLMWTQGLRDGRWTSDRSDEEDFAGAWTTLDRPPILNHWGTSALDDLIPPVVTLAMSLTSYRYVVTANEAPTNLFPFSSTNIAAQLSLPGDPDFARQWATSEINAAVKNISLNDSAWVPSADFAPTAIEWGGNMEAARNLIDILNRAIRMLAGVPATAEAEGTEQPSGVAMERMTWILAWDVMQLALRSQAAIDALGLDITIPMPRDDDRPTEQPTGTDNQGNRDADPDR